MLLIVFSLFITPATHKITIEPFDFQDEAKPESYVKGMWLLDGTGDTLIFAPLNEPVVLLIEPKSKQIQRVGGKGLGPGELGGSHPYGVSKCDRYLWVLDHNRKRLTLFAGGVYQTDFQTEGYQLLTGASVKYSIAHNDMFVVVPAYPASGYLAKVYDFAGNVVAKMGEILPIEPDLLEYNPALNNTVWRYLDNKWYCLFMFRPYFRIYNNQFELEHEVQIIGQEVDYFEERFQKREKDPAQARVQPFFTDFQVTSKNLFVMCYGVLYQMDHKGKLLSKTEFYTDDETVALLGYRPRVHFNHAVVSPEGRVYLGMFGTYHDHDLWYVDAPYLKQN